MDVGALKAGVSCHRTGQIRGHFPVLVFAWSVAFSVRKGLVADEVELTEGISGWEPLRCNRGRRWIPAYCHDLRSGLVRPRDPIHRTVVTRGVVPTKLHINGWWKPSVEVQCVSTERSEMGGSIATSFSVETFPRTKRTNWKVTILLRDRGRDNIMWGTGGCSIEESGTGKRMAVGREGGREGGGKGGPNGQRGAIRSDIGSGDDQRSVLSLKRHLPFTVRCCRDSVFTFKNRFTFKN